MCVYGSVCHQGTPAPNQPFFTLSERGEPVGREGGREAVPREYHLLAVLSHPCPRPTAFPGAWAFLVSPVTNDLYPWDFPDRNTGVDCCFFLQGTFLTQGSNLSLLPCRQILYPEPPMLDFVNPTSMHLFMHSFIK